MLCELSPNERKIWDIPSSYFLILTLWEYEIKNGRKILLIKKPKTFALIKLFDPDIKSFANKEIQAGNKKLIINYPRFLNS